MAQMSNPRTSVTQKSPAKHSRRVQQPPNPTKNMKLDKRNWPLKGDGWFYTGEEQNGVPHGWGIKAYVGEGEWCTGMEVGQFAEGVLHGRGYLLEEVEKVETVEHTPTYEEIMSTAEFDQCGRPIHYGEVPRTKRVHSFRWQMVQYGIWQGGKLKSPLRRSFLPFGKYELTIEREEIMYGRINERSYPLTYPFREFPITGQVSDGMSCTIVTPLDDDTFLLQDKEFLTILRPGEQAVFNNAPNDTCYNRFYYKIDLRNKK